MIAPLQVIAGGFIPLRNIGCYPTDIVSACLCGNPCSAAITVPLHIHDDGLAIPHGTPHGEYTLRIKTSHRVCIATQVLVCAKEKLKVKDQCYHTRISAPTTSDTPICEI